MATGDDRLRDYLQRATTELQSLRKRLREAESATAEPIAIIGMGCRFPGGVDDPRGYWDLLDTATDAITPFPADRGWAADLHHPDPGHPGTSYVDRGGFLDSATLFDAPFFTTSPREATATDPQQRVLLETTYHALDDAGLDTAALHGSGTGVYIGVMYDDYGGRLWPMPEEHEGYLGIGSASSVASGRIAYTFGFEGPTVSVDTACSSSLVTTHLAMRALRSRECDLAVVGGATVMATPRTFIEFSRQRGLAPDGRCKPFSANADGTAWSEGAGVLVLERLSDARRAGRRILAVARGSAVGQDGASGRLTAPSGPAQQRVIRAALADAGLQPSDVDVVEAHGTGTPLGDPIEANALAAVYGRDRAGAPLGVGALKSNIGHTQAAAGVAGLIKMVLAFEHDLLPRTLHVDPADRHVEWPGSLTLLTEPVPWPRTAGRPRRAGVSSFGISGTNAHVILEEPPESDHAQQANEPGLAALLVSAADENALRERARQLVDTVTAHGPGAAADALARRTLLPVRAAVLGRDVAGTVTALRDLAGEDIVTAAPSGGLAVQFAGQGGQRAGMGRALYDAEPVFARALDEAIEALDPHLDRPLRTILFGDDDSLLTRTGYAQPALFALETALYQLIRYWGTQPGCLVGHSIGEITAAHCAGVLDLTDAAKLITTRAILMQNLPSGAMIAVDATEEELTELGVDIAAVAAVAAVNGHRNLVLSGDHDDIRTAAEHLTQQGKRVTSLAVSHAFHSHHMDPILDRFRDLAATLTHHTPEIPVVSTLTGRLLAPDDWADHWARHARGTVRYADAVTELRRRGTTAFLELGPDSTLTALARGHDEVLAVPAMTRKSGDEQRTVRAAVARLVLSGGPVDRVAFAGTPGTGHVDLPPYPFQHKHYWLDPVPGADVAAAGLQATAHPLLPASVTVAASGEVVLSGRIDTGDGAWPVDHVVAGRVLLPATAFLELVARAGDEVGCGRVTELTVETPLVLDTPVQLQVVVGVPDEDGARVVSVHARAAEDQPWVRHAAGSITASRAHEPSPLPDWPPAGAEPIVTAEPNVTAYDRFAAAGYEYGPAFRGLRRAWRAGEDLVAEAVLPDDVDSTGYGLHPALLDAVLHVLLVDQDTPRLPFVWAGVTRHADGARAVRARLRPLGPDAVRLDVADDEGNPVLTVESLTLRAPGPHPSGTPRDPLYTVRWRRAAAEATVAGPVAVLGTELAAALGTAPCDDLEEAMLCEPGVVATFLGDTALGDTAGFGHATGRALELLRAALARERSARLVFVTRGAVAALPGEHVDGLTASGVWGLVRSAQAEHPDRFALVDLDPARPGVDGAALTTAIRTGLPQLAIRDGEALAPELALADTGLPVPDDAPTWHGHPVWHLVKRGETAGLDDLALVPGQARPLAAGQVRVALRAAALNFRDVVVALGMIDDDGRGVSGEGAGVVAEVGPGVTGFAVGDRVLGMMTGGVGPVTTTDHRLLAPMPAGLTWAQAAALPTVYLTAYIGLVDLARARAGETVLVHAATGGVGQAALQLASHLGLDVLTTASVPKHHHLRALGVAQDAVADSRTLDYATRYAGRRVDIVLNALAGEHVDASLGLLADGGWFLEMGKTDRRDPAAIAGTHPGVTYHAYDVLDPGPERVREMLAEIVELVARGVLRPLPVTAWDIRHAPEAFRTLSRAAHVGKLVLTIPRRLDPDGTVLVTGGTGTLGMLVARRLAERHGVRRLLLASRSGPGAEGVAALTGDLGELGVAVEVVACDLTDEDAVRAVLAAIPGRHPLTAVVHTAGAIADTTVARMTPDDLARAATPKADPAWLLHSLTKNTDLATFVLFSSAAGVLGNPGQGAYAAANTVLDGLAAHRHAAGLPAVSIGWGLWAQASGMTRHLNGTDHARLARAGLPSLDTDAALTMFDDALAAARPYVAALRVARGVTPRGPVPPVLAALLRGAGRIPRPAAAGRGPGTTAWPQRLTALPQPDRVTATRSLVSEAAAAVLGHDDATAVPLNRPFTELGFDSLTSVELSNRLASATGLHLPSALAFDQPTVARMSTWLLERLAPTPAPEESVETSLTALATALTKALAANDLDDDAARTTAVRLRELLASLDRGGEPGEVADRLDVASDADIFDFIDNELEIS
jgi:acyl transferase domain-containing protein/NADPH:quinone reductase-like Zn-dependent oxidoreductase/acyl carrier protein